MEKKEFFTNVWPEVYSSRQNRIALKWPVIGIEEHVLRFRGEEKEKVLCLVVGKERVKGLIPFQESGVDPGPNKHATRNRLLGLLGQELDFVVTNIDIDNEQFLASRKAALERLTSRTWSDLKEGDVRTCIARRVGRVVVVEVGGVEGILPASEISYGWVDEILDVMQPGETFDVKIKELDREKQRLIVSIKDLIPNPWPDAARRYAKNAFYKGVVTGVTNFGIFVALEPGVNALLRHFRSEIPRKGDEIAFVINSIDTKVGKIRGTPIRVLRRAIG